MPALVAVWLLTAGPGRAAASFFTDPDAAPVAQRQLRVFLRRSEGTVTMVVQTQAQGAPGELAWIVPVPSRPTWEVVEGDPFAALDQVTAPTFEATGESWPGAVETSSSGCGSADRESDYGGTTIFAVQHNWQGARAGSHDIDLVPGSELRAFLEGFGLAWRPDAQAVIDRYVAAGWLFVVARSSQTEVDPVLEPIAMRWTGEDLVVPLALGQLDAVEDMDVTAWIVAEGRVIPGNWTQVGIDDDAILVDGAWSNYTTLVAEQVDAAAGGKGFVTEYAQPTSFAAGEVFDNYTLELLGSDGWLTRLYTRVDPEDLRDDPYFVVDPAGVQVDNYHDLTSAEGGPYYGAALGALVWLLRRRRS